MLKCRIHFFPQYLALEPLHDKKAGMRKWGRLTEILEQNRITKSCFCKSEWQNYIEIMKKSMENNWLK